LLDLSCSIDIEGGSQLGVSFGPLQINQPLRALKDNLYRCPLGGSRPPATPRPAPLQPTTRPALEIEHTGPPGAFRNQTVGNAIRVKNTGDGTPRTSPSRTRRRTPARSSQATPPDRRLRPTQATTTRSRYGALPLTAHRTAERAQSRDI
jgi:hypothetical protein